MEHQQRAGAGALGHSKPAGWDLYFDASEYDAQDRRAQLIAELAAFFASPVGWPLLLGVSAWHQRVVVELDWVELSRLCPSSDLREALEHAPTEALACIAAAVYEALFVLRKEVVAAELHGAVPAAAKVLARLHNHPTAFRPISAILADQVGRLVAIRGTVTRATPARPLVTQMQFVCGKCGEPQDVPFPDGRYAAPTRCTQQGCRSKTFVPNKGVTACVDWQRIQVQALPKDEKQNEGRVPRPIDVELCEDLVGACQPGDVVTVMGMVRVLPGEAAAGKKSGDAKKQCLFLPFIQAVSVVCMGLGGDNGGVGGSHNRAHARRLQQQQLGRDAAEGRGGEEQLNFLPPSMQSFNEMDLAFIRTFTEACEGDQLRQLVHSLCPTIYGSELVKAGLVLALFGGVPKVASTPDRVPTRGDIHVLVVGDPGLGKSQLLQAAAGAAPRGVYVCGNTSTSAGLTVSVVRDGGEFSFDAGALVLADRGVCCMDEFDKMTGDHQALLGAMEQQEVSVAKAGLVASLPARTTVIAAANPVDGSYNKGKSLLENLKLSPAMLSRFDLVFLLLDRPDAERDQRLTEHIMALHSGLASRAQAARTRLLEYNSSHQQAAPALLTDGRGAGAGAGRPPLLQRLKVRKADDDPLPVQLLRKYIAYARQYVHPVLSEEAKSVLKAHYLHLRAQSAADAQGLPVTHRQLESLIRLAEARARVELRGTITQEDAEDVVEIMKETLEGQLAEGPSFLDFGKGGAGSGRGGRRAGAAAERRRFMDALGRHVQLKGSTELDMSDLYSVADAIELDVPSVPEFVAYLNDAGDLLKRAGSKYQYNGSVRLNSTSGAGSGRGSGLGYGSSQGQQCSQQQPGASQLTGSRRPFSQL